MYMGPIVAEADIAVRPAPSPLARRLVGAPVLVVATAVMVPWLALNAAAAGIALGVRGLVGAIDYAGTAVLGR